MRNDQSDDYLWHLVPFNPSVETGIGHAGVAVIAILAFCVCGLLAAALLTPKGYIAFTVAPPAITTTTAPQHVSR